MGDHDFYSDSVNTLTYKRSERFLLFGSTNSGRRQSFYLTPHSAVRRKNSVWTMLRPPIAESPATHNLEDRSLAPQPADGDHRDDRIWTNTLCATPTSACR